MSEEVRLGYVPYPEDLKKRIIKVFETDQEKVKMVTEKLEAGESSIIKDLDDASCRYDNIVATEVIKAYRCGPESDEFADFIKKCKDLEFARLVYYETKLLLEQEKEISLGQKERTISVEVEPSRGKAFRKKTKQKLFKYIPAIYKR